MAADSNTAYNSAADINLWIKIQAGDEYVLADFPGLLPYRWIWFRDNWDFYKPNLIAKLSSVDNASLVKQQIDDLSSYILVQRYNKSNVNPFDGSNVFYRFYLVWEQVPVDSTAISDKEQQLMDDEITRINMFSKNDFVKIKNALIALRDKASDLDTGSDPDYNKTFNRSPVPPFLLPSISDLNNQLQYQEVIKTI